MTISELLLESAPQLPPPVSQSDHVSVRLRSFMERAGLVAVVATSFENLYYVTGHPSLYLHHSLQAGRTIGALFTEEGHGRVLVSSDFEATAIRSHASDLEIRSFPIWVHIDDPHGMVAEEPARERPHGFDPATAFEVLGSAFADRGIIGRVGVDAQYATGTAREMLAEALPSGCSVVDATRLFYESRLVKSAWEIENLRLAASISEAAIAHTSAVAAPGVTAADLVSEFICAARSDVRATGMRLHFITVGTAFQPTQMPGRIPAQPGDLIKFDVGVEVNGYGADIGRTFVLGEPSAEARRVYGALRTGHDLLSSLVRPGVLLRDVFNEVMPVIQAAGIPGYVRGHVGHSVGLNREVEEWPVIGAASDIAFSDGMVFSVETPYYGHGVGSILLEDMVELTSEGITTLTTESKDLIQL